MRQRIITGLIGAVIFISLVVIGGIPFTIFISLLAIIAMAELLKIKGISPFSFVAFLSYLLILSLVLPNNWNFIHYVEFSKIDVTLLVALFLLIHTVFSKNKFTFDHVGFILVSAVYVGFGFYFFVLTREIGIAHIFFILFIIWSTDSGAYFIGRSFGKNKLWPEISPNKTIEGAVGGILSALVIGMIFHTAFPLFDTYIMMIFVVIVISIVGQLGDLVESALKRFYGVKDSGNILPGHGGILDRFDSLIFVMPILHLFQLL